MNHSLTAGAPAPSDVESGALRPVGGLSANDALMPPAPPLRAGSPIRSLADIERLEQSQPLAQALPAQSTYELLRNAAHAFGDKTALTFLPTADVAVEPVRWSYAQLLCGLHQTANLLHALGVRPRDAIGVMLPGGLEYHLALWGGAAAGVVQPLNPMLSEDKLAALLQATQARVLIVQGDAGGLDAVGAPADSLWAKAERLRCAVPSLHTVVRVAPRGEAPLPVGSLPPGTIDFCQRVQYPGDRLLSGRRIAATDIAACFHTGGTTGAPKLARHSHGAQVFTAWACVQMQGIAPQDVGINGYPLFHVAGVLPGALAALSAGAETVIPTPALFRNREVIANYWRLAERFGATYVTGVPTVLAALAQVPVDGADLSRLRYCRTGAAVLAPELAARFERLLGLHIHESLGMTEMAGISTITPPGVHAPAGCVGWRLPYAQLRIAALDAQGQPTAQDMPPGETGMVLFRSPNQFSGYLDAQDTARTFTPDGWLITGDLGFLDAEGRLHLSGRAKDLIIRSGHNIDPKTLEDALDAHPAVHLSAAVGAPDAYAGELPVVYVTLHPGAQADAAELLAFVSARVDDAAARPRWVEVIDPMPVTQVGKIYKPALRQRAACRTVAALVDATCAELAMAPSPTVQPEGETAVRVVLDATTPPGSRSLLQQRLTEVLAPLPVKVTVGP